MHYLLATIELPIVSQIVEGSKAQPYLSLRLDLDPTLVGSVMVEAGDFSPQRGANVKAIDVSLLDVPLLDADYIAVLNKMRYTPLATDALCPMPYARESTSCY